MKVYEAKFKKTSDGVFAISLVNEPATKETFIALSKQEEIKLAEVDKEQRIVMGLVLQPDQLIYRNQNGEEFNIVFRADTIKELSQNFLKSGFQLNSNLEHDEPIKGVSIVESWLVEDSKIDKSANFGFSYPKGSWIASMKIDNDEIWKDYIKTGKVQGFSVDAMVDLQEINLKSNIKMAEENKSLLDDIKVWFTENVFKKEEKTEVKLGSVTSGDIEIQYDGEELVQGVALWVMQGEEKVSLPDGEYQTEIGTLVSVDGKLTEVKTEVEAETETPVTPNTPSADEITQAIKSLLIKYSEETDAKLKVITDEMVAFKSENEKLKQEVVTLSEQPAAAPIKSEATQVELNKDGQLLELLRNNKN